MMQSSMAGGGRVPAESRLWVDVGTVVEPDEQGGGGLERSHQDVEFRRELGNMVTMGR
jgi:hypothetical protein